jgi:hypothetical protein
MSNVLDVHKMRSTFIPVSGYIDEIRAACLAGFNATPHEAPPAEISEVPLLHEWYVTGQRAASYIDYVKS